MSLGTAVQSLQAIPLFADFPPEQLRLVAFSAEPMTLPADSMLFREGADAEEGYVILSGAVQFFTQRDGAEREVSVVGPGALVGELALLCATTRPVSARTIERTELLTVSRRLLRRVLEEYPDMAERLRQSLSQRLAAFNRDLAHARVHLIDDDAADSAQAG